MSINSPSGQESRLKAENGRGGKPVPLDAITGWLLFAILCGFSLFTGDYSLLSAHILSATLFAVAAVYLIASRKTSLRFHLAFLCPMLMFVYGLAQSKWSHQRILYNGLEKSLFWLTLALVALVASQTCWKWRMAERFRVAIALFGSFEALLDILQQASHTGKYFWLFDSNFPDVYGTFAYYNNFSQLIELTLPVTLWEGIGHRGHRSLRFPYLLLAALQIGAVVASGSRAGAILVVLELLAVLLLAWWKRRETMSLAVIGLALALSFGFTYVAGFQHVIEKLQRPDQLSNRRQLNQSSLAMIKARPLTGWGLGAYAPVYKMFALYDDGTWVNQAHNDYLEWAAEGGIPYAFLMLILIVWTFRPAVRSIWGLGLLAFCLHALVDYPFARLGTCAWYFALCAILAGHGDGSPDRRPRRHRASRESLEAAAQEPHALS